MEPSSSNPEAVFRRARAGDDNGVYACCIRAIRASAVTMYNPAQVDAWAERISKEVMAERFARFDFFVATVNELICGFAALDPVTHELDYLYVDPDYQGLGLGRLLCEQVEAAARARRFRAIHLVASLNALGFYERMGFTKERDMVRNLRGINVPCVLMSKRL
jgi:putative acetyltransferase